MSTILQSTVYDMAGNENACATFEPCMVVNSDQWTVFTKTV